MRSCRASPGNVRPGGPQADSYQPTADFSRAGRSGGRPALQLPRASTPCGSSNIHLRPARVPQKLELLAPVLSSPIEEVWRESGPPAPPSIKTSRKFSHPICEQMEKAVKYRNSCTEMLFFAILQGMTMINDFEGKLREKSGADCRDRTDDLLITSQPL